MKNAKSVHQMIMGLGVVSIVAVVLLFFIGENEGLYSNYLLLLNGVCLTGIGYMNLKKEQ